MMVSSKLPEEFMFNGELKYNESLAKHTSWRVGGPADCYYKPNSVDDLKNFLSQLDDKQTIYFIGLGSNLLVRDGGIRGVVIAPLGGLTDITIGSDEIYVEAGVTSSKFARFCQKNDYMGADFLAGIPGTIGGAVRMNAGAFGSETWEFVTRIAVIDRDGNSFEINKNDLDISYREVSLDSDLWITAAWFKLSKNTSLSQGRADIKVLLDKRNESQPIGLPSCGSVFRNPNNDFAARLIESCGLKGFCIGGACVSDKHANFIINQKQCSAADIEALIIHIQKTVFEQHHVKLVLEAHIIGESL